MAEDLSLTSRPFSVPSPRGGLIQGEVKNWEDATPGSAVLVVHGFKGFKDWGFLPYVSQALAREGHWVVSFDFSHNGSVEGEIRDLGAFARNTFTRELDELLYLLGVVSTGSLTGAPLDRVGILGHSRGGADAILCAGEDPRVDALVTWGAVDHLNRWTLEDEREWRERGVVYVLNRRTGQELPLDLAVWEDYQANASRLDILGAARRLKSPWLVVHGKEDETVPVEEGMRLAGASRYARLFLVEDADHTFAVAHPFQGPTPPLATVLRATLHHFGVYLAGG